MALYEINPNNMRGSGNYFLGRSGEALGRVALVYKHANGAWYLADADAAATMPSLGITMDRAVVAGQIVRILDKGFIGRSTWTWTTGGEIYASTTPGALTQVAPAGPGDVVQIVAMATSPRMIKFSSDIGNRGAVGNGYTATALVTIPATTDPPQILWNHAQNTLIASFHPQTQPTSYEWLEVVDANNIIVHMTNVDFDNAHIFRVYSY